jgi:hypothetical protein
MANERESISLGFGIEETLDTGAAEILEALYAPEPGITANPDDVSSVFDADIQSEDSFVNDTPKPSSRKPKPQPKSPVEKQKPTLEEDEEEVTDDNYSEILRKSLSGIEEEEEDEDKALEASTSTTEKTNEDETDEPIWSSLSKDLTKLGIFTIDEDEEGNELPFVAKTPEEFKEKFVTELKIQAQNVVDNFLSKHGEDYRNAFDAIFLKGVRPEQYFTKSTEISNFKELDLEEERNQETVVRKALQQQDLEEDDIEKEITRLKNYGDLEPVSKRFHKSLVKKEEASLAKLAETKEAELKRQDEIDQQYENNVYNVIREKYQSKDFDGIPVNKQFAEKTMDFLTTKKYKLPTGELLTEFDKDILEFKRPENHQLKVKLAMLMQLVKTDPTLSSIKKRAISNESSEAFQEVVRHKSKKQTAVVKAKPKSFFD